MTDLQSLLTRLEGWERVLLLYVIMTVDRAIGQAIENLRSKPGDKYWAPIWWIALTWPAWMVVVPAKRAAALLRAKLSEGAK